MFILCLGAGRDKLGPASPQLSQPKRGRKSQTAQLNGSIQAAGTPQQKDLHSNDVVQSRQSDNAAANQDAGMATPAAGQHHSQAEETGIRASMGAVSPQPQLEMAQAQPQPGMGAQGVYASGGPGVTVAAGVDGSHGGNSGASWALPMPVASRTSPRAKADAGQPLCIICIFAALSDACCWLCA